VKRSATVLLFVFALAACNEPAPPPPPPAAPAAQRASNDDVVSINEGIQDIDGDNLLNIAYGAALVSRTGESHLESSAVQAMDGMSNTSWSSPPATPQQTMVFAFGGDSRVEQLGVTTVTKPQSPAQVRFAASSDGKSWRDVVTIDPEDKGTTLKEVKPFEARYLRVETIEPHEYYAVMTSVHAIGAELLPPERHSFDGCWTINTFPATLVQNGARITGVIGGPNGPTYVDGGIDGRVAKLMWLHGAMWGYAAATLTPDGNGLSAVTFHQDALVNNGGAAWIGERCATTNGATPPAPAEYLRRVGRWTMSGLIFDGEEHLIEEPSREVLDAAASLLQAEPAQRFRISAMEFRGNDPSESLRRTKARVDAVRAALLARHIDVARIEFLGRGSDGKGIEMPSAVQRMLWSRIDLERVGR
jgi:hypothetical protein